MKLRTNADRRILLRRMGLGLALVTALGLWVPQLARSQEAPPAEAGEGGKAAQAGAPKEAAPAAGEGGNKGKAAPAGEGEKEAKPAAGGAAAAAAKKSAATIEGERPPPGGGYTLADKPAAEVSPLHGGKSSLSPITGRPGSSTPANCPVCPVGDKDEVAVLMQLRERHTLLSARENLVAQKEAALKKLEASLDAQLTRFDVAINKMESRLEVGDAKVAKRDGQVKAVVQTLQGLSAKKAAPMLAEAQPDLVAEIFRELGPVRVASLLSVMPPAKAGKLIDLSVDKPGAPKAHRPTAPGAASTRKAASPDAPAAANKPGAP